MIKIALAELPALQQAVIESLLLDRISERRTAALYGLKETLWKEHQNSTCPTESHQK